MKRILFACALILMLMTTTAHAVPAIVVNEGQCGLLDGDGGSYVSTDVHTVVANNAEDGNFTFKCSAKNLPNSTGAVVKYDYESTLGLPCTWFSGGVSTNDWHMVVSKTGNTTLTCKFEYSDF